MVHFDNAPIHNTEEIQEYLTNVGFGRMEHPSYNPDLAPYKFLLFRAIKENCFWYRFNSLDDLFIVVENFLNVFSEDFPQIIFQKWIRRLQICSDNDKEYIE
jgi:hypothetical protein